LSFSVYGEDALVAAHADLAAAYTRRNPMVEIEVTSAPDVSTAASELTAASDDRSPPDVFIAGERELPGLVQDDLVQPLDELLEDRGVDFGDGYQRDALEAFSAESALQCMPADVSPLVVYYNTDLLRLRTLDGPDEEPPRADTGWTWEQFDLAARRLSRQALHGLYLEPSIGSIAPFVWSAGGSLVDDESAPTTLRLSEGDAQGALEQLLALVRTPGVVPSPAQLAEQDAASRFASGKLGMIVGPRALTPGLRSSMGWRFDVMPLPRIGRAETLTEASGFCISSASKQVDAAADFVTFAVGRRGSTILARSGYVVPTNVEVLYSKAFSQPGLPPAHASVFRQGVRGAGRVPFVPQWPDVEQATRPLLERLFYASTLDLDVALARIDAASQPLLAVPEPSPTEDGE
jgi:multiple sugar transport system substrate-binding protein